MSWSKNLFNPSGRKIPLVPGKSITILKLNKGGCQKQKWCRFFSDAILLPHPLNLQLFHIIGGNKAYLAPPAPNATSHGCQFIY